MRLRLRCIAGLALAFPAHAEAKGIVDTTDPNLDCSNGMVQVIDTVLLPPR